MKLQLESPVQSVFKILTEDGAQYIIPVFQRNYTWQKKQCEELLRDCKKLQVSGSDSHFFGPIIIAKDHTSEDENPRYIVIDGQQRLTTISILIKAILNDIVDEDERKELSALLHKDKTKLKLKPNNKDDKAYQKIFSSGDRNNNNMNSNIEVNYEFFCNNYKTYITDTSIKGIKDIILKRLLCVVIKISEGDPHIVFESINSKGVHLNCADLIRNFMLMSLKSEVQNEFYNSYWMKIEEEIGDIAIENFMFYFLRYKLSSDIKKSEIYSFFQKYAKDKEKKDILIELEEYSKLYAVFTGINGKQYNKPKIQQYIKSFIELDKDVQISYLFALITDFENNKISEEEVVKSLHLIETLMFRKLFINNTTQGLNKIFLHLHSKIVKVAQEKNIKYHESCYEILSPELAKVNNDKFKLALNDAINIKAKITKYLLQRMENYNNKYPIHFDRQNQKYEIDHIFAKKKADKFRTDYGEDWDFLNQNIEGIANLTIMEKVNNGKASNKSDEHKSSVDEDGNKLWLNEYRTCPEYITTGKKLFTKAVFEKRQKQLIDRAFEIWHLPDNIKVTGKIEAEKIDISEIKYDELNKFTGTKPTKIFIFTDDNNYKDIQVKDWKGCIIKIVEEFYDLSPQDMKDYWDMFKRSSNDDYSKTKQGFKFATCMNTKDMMRNIKKMFDKYNLVHNIEIEYNNF